MRQEALEDRRAETRPNQSFGDVWIRGIELVEVRVGFPLLEAQLDLPAKAIESRHQGRGERRARQIGAEPRHRGVTARHRDDTEPDAMVPPVEFHVEVHRARGPRGEKRRCCMKTLRGGGALLGTLRRGHTTGMQSKVHPTYKTKYRVANWPAYNQTLVRRGDVTVWLSSEAIAAWTPRRSGRRGGQRRYSDLAIETALTLRLLYHLPLRQAEGFLHALFGMMRLDLSAHDYTTLSRRSQHLRRRLRPVPTDEGIHLVLDSTGLSIVGEGEWAAAKHGGRGRRGWAEAPPWRRSVRRDPCPHADRGDG